jgi:hypothetical protein
MWVGFAIDSHARPSVLDDLDMGGMNVRVGLDKVVADNGSELLGRVDGVLFGEDVGCLLLRVGRDYDRVVCFSVAGNC